jgi:hypothetical protein
VNECVLVHKRGSTNGSEGPREETGLRADADRRDVECASRDGRHWRIEGISPASFKIGPLHRYPAWKLERRLSQLCPGMSP